MATTLNTCRDCKVQKILLIKYSVRHYVCLICAGERGLDFVISLKTWQLESLPIFWLSELGWLKAVIAEVERREAGVMTRQSLAAAEISNLLAND